MYAILVIRQHLGDALVANDYAAQALTLSCGDLVCGDGGNVTFKSRPEVTMAVVVKGDDLG